MRGSPALHEKCPYSVLFWSVFSHIRTEYEEIRTHFTNMDTLRSADNLFKCYLKLMKKYQTATNRAIVYTVVRIVTLHLTL